MNRLKKYIEYKAYHMRQNIIKMTTQAQSGHPTSALSSADIVATLFYDAMRFDLANPNNPNNDRFILSKGHASPVLYAVYKELGVLTEEELMGYRTFNSILEGHPTPRFAYTEAATGSLGIGLSVGVGMALSAKMDNRPFHTYVLMGDGEVAEGSVWEAAELAHYYKLDNLVGIIDCNRLGQTGETLHGFHAKRYAEKFEAFGWKSIVVDGHNVLQLMHALQKARDPNGHPTIIIAKTIKGYGIVQVEDKNGYHGKPFPADELPMLMAELAVRFPAAVVCKAASYDWHPIMPAHTPESIEKKGASTTVTMPSFTLQESVATRKAYGMALAAMGSANERIVSLDAEVKNSTFAEIFEQQFPQRFIQCFIAEQNMVGMATGLYKRGHIPYVSTFAAFFSRCYDQIRMAAIGNAALRLIGSHAGVSIGEDGPSQMGLEDIALMRAIPHSCVLYPSDAVSTAQLVQEMSLYMNGISYLRTTRMATPVIYDNNEQFNIGGCKLLHSSDKDVACVIAAGITLHEALKAHALLAQEGIAIAVIDLYSIKPLDRETVIAVANKAGRRIITVEDHYVQGGLGEAVVAAVHDADIRVDCLAVKEVPRSGKPEELLAWAGIDADAIVRVVKGFSGSSSRGALRRGDPVINV